jgi:hypothetical protein
MKCVYSDRVDQRMSKFNANQTVKPGEAEVRGFDGGVSHSPWAPQHPAPLSRTAHAENYRVQMAQRRRELAARARMADAPHAHATAAFRPATAAPTAPATFARHTASAAPKHEVGSLWRQRQLEQAASEQERQHTQRDQHADGDGQASARPGAAPASSRRSEGRTPRRAFGGGSAPPPQMSTNEFPAASRGQTPSQRPRTPSADRGPTPVMSRRSTPRNPWVKPSHVPHVDVNRAAAHRGQHPATASSHATNHEATTPHQHPPPSSARARSKSPNPIAADTYNRLLACGAYRPVLIAAEAHHSQPAAVVGGVHTSERKSELLKEIRARIRRAAF